MEKAIAVIQTALPVFLALGLGMLCRSRGFLSREGVDALKKVVINLTLPFVLLGARLFGGFDIAETDALRTVPETKVPILIIHGQEDTLVPCTMSKAVQNANPQMVRYLLVPGAEHAISYLVDRAAYRKAVLDFIESLK